MNFFKKWFDREEHHEDVKEEPQPSAEDGEESSENPQGEEASVGGTGGERGAAGGESGGRGESAESGEKRDSGVSPHDIKELEYLKQLMRYRLDAEFHPEAPATEPPMPAYEEWQLPLGAFIRDFPRDNNGTQLGPDEARLLLIALVHHVQPDFFDQVIDSGLKGGGDFPKIGGIRGKDFRGFMPTGDTALFLLAGNDWKQRLVVQRLFWADHPFAKKRILWLEDIAPGEPVTSGKITLSRDYVDIFTHDRVAPPHFGMSFPAKQVTTDRTREDLVIDKQLSAQLDDLLDWTKYHDGLVRMGGQDGRFKNGYRALFYGPSGTGKTFAACILGKETNKEVYRVDLSMVVSKYIGETEKNLELVFARAESKKWILFFDEADALFGKRASVRDAHDKYANQEVSYLLQRIEDYDGLVILATNMKNNIDEAFIRRFNAVLRFSMPDAEERKKIWEKTFPAGVEFREKYPVKPGEKGESAHGADQREAHAKEAAGEAGIGQQAAEKKKFDIPEVVKGYELSGGNIVNIVHYAGIKAAKSHEERAAGDEALTIYLPDVIDGIRHELGKNGIPFNLKEHRLHRHQNSTL